MLFQKSCRLFAAFGFGSRTLSPVPQRVVNVGLPPPHSHAIAMSRPSLPSSSTVPVNSTTETFQYAADRKAMFRRSSCFLFLFFSFLPSSVAPFPRRLVVLSCTSASLRARSQVCRQA